MADANAFGLQWNPFQSRDGENDFFASPWTSRTTDEWKRFLSGAWRDPKEWANPAGVVANPAQQIADPGNFFTREGFNTARTEGKIPKRTVASALIAGALYGGAAYGGAAAGGESGSAGGVSGAEAGSGASSSSALDPILGMPTTGEGAGGASIGNGGGTVASKAGEGGWLQDPENLNMVIQLFNSLGQGFDPNNAAAPAAQTTANAYAGKQSKQETNQFIEMLRKALLDPNSKSHAVVGKNGGLSINLVPSELTQEGQSVAGPTNLALNQPKVTETKIGNDKDMMGRFLELLARGNDRSEEARPF